MTTITKAPLHVGKRSAAMLAAKRSVGVTLEKKFPKIQGPSCFPPTASVSLENGELVTMSQLQLGNQVQTGRYI